jgi:hypothetical protein
MNYKGKLYGKLGRVYFDTGRTSNDFDGLLEALKVCYKSLCTYGNHPIIEKQVNQAIKKATE